MFEVWHSDVKFVAYPFFALVLYRLFGKFEKHVHNFNVKFDKNAQMNFTVLRMDNLFKKWLSWREKDKHD